MHKTNLELTIISLIIVASSVIMGYIFEKIVLSKLKKFAEKTSWRGDDVLFAALRKMIIPWFLLIGIYIMITYLPLTAKADALLSKIMTVSSILLATILSSRIAVGFVTEYNKNLDEVVPTTSIFTNITRIVIFIIGILIALQSIGISVTPILTALGVGGLAVALALQDTLSNLFSGLQILGTKQIRPGDYIKIDGGTIEGYVTDINWRSTTIKALQNNVAIVPNSKLATSIVINYHLPVTDLAIALNIGISYNSDIEHVEKVTKQTALKVLNELKIDSLEEPVMRINTFGDSSINFSLIVFLKEYGDQNQVKHILYKAIHKAYKEEHIEIPYPIRTVHLQK